MNKNMSLIISIIAMMMTMFAQAQNDVAMRAIKHARGRQQGGIVEKPNKSNVVRVLDVQREFESDKLEQLTKEIRQIALLPIEYVQNDGSYGGSPFEIAERLVASVGVGAGIVVVDDPMLPIELFSPDGRWGIMNIAPLKKDNPDSIKFEMRFSKVYWSVIARTLGAGMSSYPGCVLVPYSNMKQLDAITATRPCPEPFNKMIETGKSYGIKTISIASYRTACEQGWAPAPTNDVQKAIWDEVHEIPAEPIKIKRQKK